MSLYWLDLAACSVSLASHTKIVQPRVRFYPILAAKFRVRLGHAVPEVITLILRG